jgi:hypothetical protein
LIAEELPIRDLTDAPPIVTLGPMAPITDGQGTIASILGAIKNIVSQTKALLERVKRDLKTKSSRTDAWLGNIERAVNVLCENFETQEFRLDAVQGRGESEVRLDPTGQNATEENPDLQYPTDFEVGSISLSIFDSEYLSSQAKNQLGVNMRYAFTHLIVVAARILISCCRNSNQSRKAPMEVAGVHPVVNSAGNHKDYPTTIAKRMLLSSKCAYQQRAEYLSNTLHCKCAYQQRIKIMTYMPGTSVLTRQ